jgi:hypothetical protein
VRLLRVKPEHAVYRLPGGRIQIGEQSLGTAAEIEDPTGCVWSLLRAMDGPRGTDEIVDRVTERHPGESPLAVKAAIAALMEAGYVEDCGGPGAHDSRVPDRLGRPRRDDDPVLGRPQAANSGNENHERAWQAGEQRGADERRRVTDPFRDRPGRRQPGWRGSQRDEPVIGVRAGPRFIRDQ